MTQQTAKYMTKYDKRKVLAYTTYGIEDFHEFNKKVWLSYSNCSSGFVKRKLRIVDRFGL